MQTQIDFSQRPQNSFINQRILDEAAPRLNRQCKVLLAAFERGQILKVEDGILGIWDFQEEKIVKIGDLRARCRDLREKGFNIGHRTLSGGYREFFLIKGK